MITRFITEVHARFDPFARSARTCRLLLAQFSPAVWPQVKFKTDLLPRASSEPGALRIKFQDGKEMTLDPGRMGIKDVEMEIDRHSRMLGRKAELAA